MKEAVANGDVLRAVQNGERFSGSLSSTTSESVSTAGLKWVSDLVCLVAKDVSEVFVLLDGEDVLDCPCSFLSS